MILVNYQKDGHVIFAFLVADRLYACHVVDSSLPGTSQEFLSHAVYYTAKAQLVFDELVYGAKKVTTPYLLIGEADKVDVVVWPE